MYGSSHVQGTENAGERSVVDSGEYQDSSLQEQQVTPAVTSSDRFHTLDAAAVQKAFEEACAALRVDDETFKRAQYYLSTLLTKNYRRRPPGPDEVARDDAELSNIWRGCALFIASLQQLPEGYNLIRDRSQSGFKLNKLLLECNISLSDLFDNLEEAMLLCNAGAVAYTCAQVQQALSQLKHTYVVMTLLYKKFELLWDTSRNFFDDDSPQAGLRATLSEQSFDTAWLLFITMRRKWYGKSHLDLASLYKLLVALVFFVRFAPLEKQAGSESAPPVQGKRELLRKLCILAKLELDQVEEMKSVLRSFLRSLAEQGPAQSRKSQSVARAFCLESLASASLRDRLSKNYETGYLRSCADFDSRLFLDKNLCDKIASTPAKVTGRKAAMLLHPQASRRKLFVDAVSQSDSDADCPATATAPVALARAALAPQSPSGAGTRLPLSYQSPAPSQRPLSAQPTPVSAAVEASSWLRRETSGGVRAGVSGELRRFFERCERNPADEIAGYLARFQDVLLRHHSLAPGRALQLDEEATEQPRKSRLAGEAMEMASAIYHTALESILLLEADRLQVNRFDKLLHNESFHCALFVCAMEVVCCAKQIFSLMYPASLVALQLSPFHLIKVIDSFVKGVPSLPQMLRQHMHVIEEDILESQAWKPGSVVFELMGKKKEAQTKASTPEQQEQPSRMTAIGLIQSKLAALAMTRIRGLCLELNLGGHFPNNTWLAVQHCLSDHIELMRDRHLDQIILCSMYGVAKVQQMSKVTFKSIIRAYRDQEQYIGHSTTYDSIIKQVVINAYERLDIIKFYNRVFVPVMKSFLLQFRVRQSASRSSAGESPRRPPPPARQQVRGGAVFYSPRPARDAGRHMTPRTRALYAFSESPAADLRAINRSLTKRKPRLLRPSLNLDGDAEEDQQYAKRARRSRVGLSALPPDP